MAAKKKQTPKVAPSGAVADTKVASEIDMNHPAIDSDPRSASSEAATRIDLNDPTKTDAEAVSANLEASK